MDVPDMMLYLTERVSLTSLETEPLGDHVAKISVPGALISGFQMENRVEVRFLKGKELQV